LPTKSARKRHVLLVKGTASETNVELAREEVPEPQPPGLLKETSPRATQRVALPRMRRGRRFPVANLIEIRFGDLPSRDLRSRCPLTQGGVTSDASTYSGKQRKGAGKNLSCASSKVLTPRYVQL
jgi:hypothetical protein